MYTACFLMTKPNNTFVPCGPFAPVCPASAPTTTATIGWCPNLHPHTGLQEKHKWVEPWMLCFIPFYNKHPSTKPAPSPWTVPSQKHPCPICPLPMIQPWWSSAPCDAGQHVYWWVAHRRHRRSVDSRCPYHLWCSAQDSGGVSEAVQSRMGRYLSATPHLFPLTSSSLHTACCLPRRMMASSSWKWRSMSFRWVWVSCCSRWMRSSIFLPCSSAMQGLFFHCSMRWGRIL